MKKGKKYLEAVSKVDKTRVYTLDEAVKLVKETSVSKFDGSVEIAMRLNLDTRKSDQQLRGAIVLPNGTGKEKKVLVIAKGDNAKKYELMRMRDKLKQEKTRVTTNSKVI